MEERVELLSGRDTWRTAEVERLGIGSVKVTDGPNGARGDSTTGRRRSAFRPPSGSAPRSTGTSWPRLARCSGGRPCGKGSHVLLAPTINLARHPLGGRNFESFGEDPFLTAELAVAYVDGVQSEGVGACAKHFVANDVEFARMTVSSEVDEAVLREVYLAPFEAVVSAGVWTVMASYPMLNGVHCTEHRWLLTTVLRDEWGFDGLVMSDWGATHHPARPVLAGLDLEMPGPAMALGDRLRAAVDSGEVAHRGARRASRSGARPRGAGRPGRHDRRRAGADGGARRRPDPSPARSPPRAWCFSPTTEPSRSTPAAPPRSASSDPTPPTPSSRAAGRPRFPPHRQVSVVDGFVAAVGADRVTTAPGCLAHRYLPPPDPNRWVGGDQPIQLDLLPSTDATGEPLGSRERASIAAFAHGPTPDGAASQRWTGRMRIDDTGEHSFGVLAVGRSRVLVDGVVVADNWTSPRAGDAFFQHGSAEVVGSVALSAGSTVEVVVEWSIDDHAPVRGLRFGYLPPVDHDALLEEAVVAAQAADVAVVVVGLNNEWETEGHDRPGFSLPGAQDELVRRVAGVNERTIVVVNAGSPVDLPWFDEVAATLVAWYPGQELGHAVADVVLGRTEPGGRLPLTWPRRLADSPFELPIPEPGPPRPGAVLPYSEGLLIGYRSYDRFGVEPRAPFGFGLGYTTFELGSPTLVEEGREPGHDATVVVPVTNTGDPTGQVRGPGLSRRRAGALDIGARPRRPVPSGSSPASTSCAVAGRDPGGHADRPRSSLPPVGDRRCGVDRRGRVASVAPGGCRAAISSTTSRSAGGRRG